MLLYAEGNQNSGYWFLFTYKTCPQAFGELQIHSVTMMLFMLQSNFTICAMRAPSLMFRSCT